MKIRFMEYVPVGDSQMNLFFMQERSDLFSVIFHAKGEKTGLIKLRKVGEKNWAVTSQNVPEWAQLIEPYLGGILEHRLASIGHPE